MSGRSIAAGRPSGSRLQQRDEDLRRVDRLVAAEVVPSARELLKRADQLARRFARLRRFASLPALRRSPSRRCRRDGARRGPRPRRHAARRRPRQQCVIGRSRATSLLEPAREQRFVKTGLERVGAQGSESLSTATSPALPMASGAVRTGACRPACCRGRGARRITDDDDLRPSTPALAARSRRIRGEGPRRRDQARDASSSGRSWSTTHPRAVERPLVTKEGAPSPGLPQSCWMPGARQLALSATSSTTNDVCRERVLRAGEGQRDRLAGEARDVERALHVARRLVQVRVRGERRRAEPHRQRVVARASSSSRRCRCGARTTACSSRSRSGSSPSATACRCACGRSRRATRPSVPECVGWPLGPTGRSRPSVADHDAEPDSKPGFASFWPEAQPLVPLTVRLNVVVCEPEAAPVPVIVIGYVPAGVEADVESVSVDEAPEVTLPARTTPIAPAGSPLALSETDCAEPDVVAVDTVAVVPLPAVTVPAVGLTEIEKSFAGGGRAGPEGGDAVRRAEAGRPVVADAGRGRGTPASTSRCCRSSRRTASPGCRTGTAPGRRPRPAASPSRRPRRRSATSARAAVDAPAAAGAVAVVDGHAGGRVGDRGDVRDRAARAAGVGLERRLGLVRASSRCRRPTSTVSVQPRALVARRERRAADGGDPRRARPGSSSRSRCHRSRR